MKAALLLGPEQLEMVDMADPEPAEGDVLIEPDRVGICGTDISFYSGHRPASYPMLPGHEVVGHVIATGDRVTKHSAGHRVVVEPNYPCGKCPLCRAGRGAICANKKSMGVNVPGCFCERVTVPSEFVWALPDAISDVDAATIEPLAVSMHALFQSGVQRGDTVAVLGCGVVGLLLIHAAVAEGVRVLAHDKSARKLQMARNLGALAPENAETAGVWQHENVTAVFECAGVSAAVELALSAAPRGSRVVLLGLPSSPASFSPMRLVREGIRVDTSMIYDHPADFQRTIDLVAGGALHPARVVTDTLPFTSIDQAFQLARTGQSGKIHVELK